MWMSAVPAWTSEVLQRRRGGPERGLAPQVKKHNMLRCDHPSNHYILWFPA